MAETLALVALAAGSLTALVQAARANVRLNRLERERLEAELAHERSRASKKRPMPGVL